MADVWQIGTLDQLVKSLPAYRDSHARTESVYADLHQVAERIVALEYSQATDWEMKLGSADLIQLPFTKMGAITSVDLLGLDELIIFSFYLANRTRYNRVVDIGANIGLHSIVLSRCGYEVTAFEPDPEHYKLLSTHLELNGCTNVEAVQAAVSSKEGTTGFIRVLGNTTGSHIAGAKSDPYGELEEIEVRTVGASDATKDADLLKIDAEGHEVEILKSIPIDRWSRMDAFVEVGTPENAAVIFDHFRGTPVNLFSQKLGWGNVSVENGMPASYKEGSLFISWKPQMTWSV